MPEAGLEPARRFNSPLDFKSSASAIPPLGHELPILNYGRVRHPDLKNLDLISKIKNTEFRAGSLTLIKLKRQALLRIGAIAYWARP